MIIKAQSRKIASGWEFSPSFRASNDSILIDLSWAPVLCLLMFSVLKFFCHGILYHLDQQLLKLWVLLIYVWGSSRKWGVSCSCVQRSDGAKQNEGNSKTETLERDIKELKKELEKAHKEVEHLTTDRDALKSQAESLSKEYTRLCDEHARMERSLAAGEPSNKKDN